MSYNTGLWGEERLGVGAFYFSTQVSAIYNGNGEDSGSVPIDSNVYNVGDTVTVLGNTGSLTKEAYIFVSWNTESDGTGTTYFPGDTFTINSDITLYARWLLAGFGHIGAFYFGPVDEIIESDVFEISAVLLQPDVSVVNSVSVEIISPILFVNPVLLQPIVYSTQDIKVQFIGVPRAGSSPLTVDFTAIVTLSPEIKGIYKVKEYVWCFDYDFTNSTSNIAWVTTTQNPISHVYTGYSGQKYSVKLCVNLELID